MGNQLIVPPFRTSLLTANGVPLSALGDGNGDLAAGGPPDRRTTTTIETTRDWWLYWRTLAEFANNGLNMLTFGTASDRPDASTMPDGAIYVESDRSGVIYQNQGGEWHYLAGTMYGTLSPDQRPTGLGPNDAGFDFRSTDTNPLLGAREFIWSGSIWVEATAVLYGTHAQRPAGSVAPARCLYVETDRSEVLYQNQNGTWHFVAGTMLGTLVPDQRPTDLGVNDAGFTFRATDVQRQFIWSGTAWVETTQTQGDAQIAYANGSITLTGSPTAIPGASITLNRAGRYLITGNYTFVVIGTGDLNQGMRGDMVANGVGQAGTVLATAPASPTYLQASQQWMYTAVAANQVVFLRGYKDAAGTGTSQAISPFTSISAVWIAP